MLPTNPALIPPANFPALWAVAWGEDTYGYWQAFEIKGVRQVMRWIVSGEFLMGSPENESQRGSDEKQHKVKIEDGFWLADTACTQALWQVVMQDNPSHFKDSEQNPVDSVSWLDCQVFVEKANSLLNKRAEDVEGANDTENKLEFLSLPSEAQWEYACRAGSITPFNTGETITTDQANFNGHFPYRKEDKKGKFRKKTLNVLSFKPNAWGLFQMHGNVYEWCLDIYDKAYYHGDNDISDVSSLRVLRGGLWIDSAQSLRSAYRYADSPDDRHHLMGLRLAGGLDPQAR